MVKTAASSRPAPLQPKDEWSQPFGEPAALPPPAEQEADQPARSYTGLLYSREGSAAIGGETVRRVARVAAAVHSPHIDDGGVRVLGLDLERGDQRILRIDDDAVRFALGPEADGEMRYQSAPSGSE